MARAARVRLTASFERNLEALAAHCDESGAPQAFERLLDELSDTVIPNLERFPQMGRAFLERPARSVEAGNGLDRLRARLGSLEEGAELREYLMAEHLVLYLVAGARVFLLSIRHHRQLSFDFEALWLGG
ncbi:MAG TPA: type II toxin-antitoxin system RelE/ParE family toxin [Quisquiliibacterium sp.]|nr:type II toxin-antitoxin system RelE/ParE family toxin [Quisquiliibacterium sp.]